MSKTQFDQAVQQATVRDPRYAADAYAFLRDALDFTIRSLQKRKVKVAGHVSGPQLCEGLREYAIREYGPMVPTILEAWGVKTTRDIGEMVFNLIDAGIFSKSSSDCVEDFENVYTFEDAFVQPFLPKRG